MMQSIKLSAGWGLLIAAPMLYAAPAPSPKLLDVDGYKVNVLTLGAIKPGVPAVVFESGLGSTLEEWGTILTDIATSTQVIAYERAGIGASESRVEPRNLARLTRELHALLEKLAVPAPYVLVGHSYGGAIVHAFALAHPKDVAGLVYLDSTDFVKTRKDRLAESKDELEVGDRAMHDLLEARLSDLPEGIRAEGRELQRMHREGFSPALAAWRSELNVPVTILLAGNCSLPVRADDQSAGAVAWRKVFTEVARYERYCRADHARRLSEFTQLVQQIPQGTVVLSMKSRHYIHWDEPELVSWGIRRVMSAAAVKP